MNAVEFLSAVVVPVSILTFMLYANSNDFRDKQRVMKLIVGAWGPYVPSTGNVISATAGLVYINLQPEYELPSSTRFGQF